MKTNDVSAFGEILWDIYEHGASMRPRPGGAPLNLCLCVQALGARSELVGGIGQDRFGEGLLQVLRRAGVDTRAMCTRPERTGITFIKRERNGEPSFLFYRHNTADVAFEAADLIPHAGNARFAVVGTSTLMRPNLRRATDAYLGQASAFGAFRVVDLNVRAHMWTSRKEMLSRIHALAKRADIIKASTADLAHLGDPEPLLFAPKALWFVTDGSRPATVMRRGEVATIPTPAPVRVVDATGAGDAFLGTVLAHLAKASPRRPASPPLRAVLPMQACIAAVERGHRIAAKIVASEGNAGLSRIRRPVW
jgi:fructokinase